MYIKKLFITKACKIALLYRRGLSIDAGRGSNLLHTVTVIWGLLLNFDNYFRKLHRLGSLAGL